jgi:hypothetical protein
MPRKRVNVSPALKRVLIQDGCLVGFQLAAPAASTGKERIPDWVRSIMSASL